jgi:hypothetical protein
MWEWDAVAPSLTMIPLPVKKRYCGLIDSLFLFVAQFITG